jgi:hypothetical protein
MTAQEIKTTYPDNMNPDRIHDEEHRDPITGAPGAHPLGAGIGAASAGVAGAAIGAALGPAGSVAGGVIGAVVGAVAGGLAGKGVAEAVHPTNEDAYWRETYKTRPYYQDAIDYEDYRPAYEFGWMAAPMYTGKTWEESEDDLRHNWEAGEYGTTTLNWDHAKNAVRDSFERASDQLRSSTYLANQAVTDNFPGQPGSDEPARSTPDRPATPGAPQTLGTTAR